MLLEFIKNVQAHERSLTSSNPVVKSIPENLAYQFTDVNGHKTVSLIGNAIARRGASTFIRQWLTEERPDGIQTQDAIALVKQFNGMFLLTYEDSKNQLFQWVNDFLGFFPWYVYEDPHRLLFTSSMRSIYRRQGISLDIDLYAILNYLNNGHLLNDQSWFKQLKRCRPATLFTYHCDSGRWNEQIYWTWSMIGPKSQDATALREAYIQSFEHSVLDLEIPEASRVAVGLSGGLDSRWIAQIASIHPQLQAYFFANESGWEYRLSKKIAAALGIPHVYHVLSNAQWLENRLQLLWECEACLHLGHLHEGWSYHQQLYELDLYYHGFYGGGIYAGRNLSNRAMHEQAARKVFHSADGKYLTELPYLNFPSIDPYYAFQRIRHQSAHSIQLLAQRCKVVVPFYDMTWFECNYRVDDCLQLHGKFYLESLNDSLQKNVLEIPWQRTGIPPQHIFMNRMAQAIRWPYFFSTMLEWQNRSKHFMNYRTLDPQINQWINHFKKDAMEIHSVYPLKSREQKMRMLSIVVWMKMLQQNTAHVL